jgi:phosphatidate cytidylyltransferase
VLTAALLAPLAVAGVLLLPTQTLAVCAGVICVIGAAEWGRLIGLITPAGRIAYVTMYSLLMGLLWQYRSLGTLEIAAFAGAAWWLLAWLWLGNFEFAAGQERRNVWLKGAAGLLTVIPAWSALILIHRGPVAGHWWLLYVLVLIWLADVAAFFTGRLFGHTKLAPRISPGKTYAGVYGALAGTVLLAVAVDLWFESLTLLPLLALSLVTVVFSIIGDLFESLIKRHSNFKDSGALLPGHGGVFDRIDSVVAALPIFAAGKLLLGL